jgi:putative NAD(P)-binding protein
MKKSDTLITIFGGSGFLGREVVRTLAERRYRLCIAVRHPHLAGHLRPPGRFEEIQAVRANVCSPRSVTAAVRDAEIVINLVGILVGDGACTHACRYGVCFDDALDGGSAVCRIGAGEDGRTAIGAPTPNPCCGWGRMGRPLRPENAPALMRHNRCPVAHARNADSANDGRRVYPHWCARVRGG